MIKNFFKICLFRTFIIFLPIYLFISSYILKGSLELWTAEGVILYGGLGIVLSFLLYFPVVFILTFFFSNIFRKYLEKYDEQWIKNKLLSPYYWGLVIAMFVIGYLL